ncbi:MAG TPA: hypothetical protein VJ720_11510 [Chitinophaga sp.]|nr:hypothetical protein [Chitinophaga sp.]
MKYSLKQDYPIATALLLLYLLLFIICRQVLQQTNGHFCYPLDDTFIHMSIAKNFALNGIWGITAQEFSAASSSPLYTFILAIFFKSGINSIWIPLYINLVFATLLVIVTDRLLQRFNIQAWVRCTALVLVVLLVPVPVMTASGMEHMLHAFLAMWLLYLYSDRHTVLSGIVGGLAILARFESLFLVAGITAIGLYNRKWLQTAVILAISLVPMMVFGYISVQHGAHMLPNSVLLKAAKLSGGGSLGSTLQEIVLYKLIYGNNTMVNIFTNRFYPEGSSSLSGTTVVRFLLIIPVLVLLLKAGNVELLKKMKQLACIALITTFLHMALAAVGWLFRYEAYLVAINLVVIVILLDYYIRQVAATARRYSLIEKLVFTFLVAFVCAPFPLRAAGAFMNLPHAARNIYEQQYQMGAFLREKYQHTAVAANDVGAVSYYSGNRILDLWGLGNNEVAEAKLGGRYSPAFLGEFAGRQQVKIAMVYDTWFDSTLLRQWKKVAAWKISNNVICGGDEVSFYAVDPAEAASLRQKLTSFQPSLPAGVLVTYYPEHP